ncbi:MAG: DNA polymerase IV [bacterium]|nr:DNA polymerase IV [bacterium]
MNQPPRTIIHLDMNAFFAAVEQAANPSLRDLPIAVTGARHRTVILTASYAAKRAGIKTGDLLHEARSRCPSLRLVPADPDKYIHTSQAIMSLLKNFTPLVEVASIDEAFLDVTHSLHLFPSIETLAQIIKHEIKSHFNLTCSLGVAPNKLLAKLAAEQQKPDGLVIVTPNDLPHWLAPIPLSSLCGIGPHITAFFHQRGIHTCGDLQRLPLPFLQRHFGALGLWLHNAAFGRDNSPVIPTEDAPNPKSVGHSMTLERNAESREDVLRYLLQLSEMVGRRLRAHHLTASTVAVTIRFASFHTITTRQTFHTDLSQSNHIYHCASTIWKRMPMLEPVRLVGLSVSSLTPNAQQLPLFPSEQRRMRLALAQDLVNDRFGDYALFPATLLLRNNRTRIIAPAWRPEGLRNTC